MRIIEKHNGVVTYDSEYNGQPPSNNKQEKPQKKSIKDILKIPNLKIPSLNQILPKKEKSTDNNTSVSITENKLDISKLIKINNLDYSVIEVIPSKLTSNNNVKWLLIEIARLYKPLSDRLKLLSNPIEYDPELVIWWEIVIKREEIHFYLVLPNDENIKSSISRQVKKTWKQSTVKEVPDHSFTLSEDSTSITSLTLKNNPVLSLKIDNPTYSSLDSILNAKYYLQDDDIAMLQIGIEPIGNDWNSMAVSQIENMRETKNLPKKKDFSITPKKIAKNLGIGVGLLSEELMNLLGFLVLPGWEDDVSFSDSLKTKSGEINTTNTRYKIRNDVFKTTIRLIASSTNEDRRESTLRALSSGFDPLSGDNKFIEKKCSYKDLKKMINKVTARQHTRKYGNEDILGAIELSKIINVPDQKAQIEYYNELSVATHRGECEVPQNIFIDDGGIPFCQYQNTDGAYKQGFFSAKNKNLLCLPRVVIGEPNSGKTTFACNFALDAFNRGYSCFAIDAADGKMIDRILSCITPEQRDKVKIIDFLNTELPIGLGWAEAFRVSNLDIIEDTLVEEVIRYIELVADTQLNMRSRQWVENSVKAVYVRPDATLADVENMLCNAQFREKIIPNIQDPQLKNDWEYYHNKLNANDRKTIYDEAWRRLAPVMRKKTLKNFILQKPKIDENGEYLVDFRKWMDEGYMVLIKANETLTESIQTALVSFVLAKFNLAVVSREDLEEDDRPPCFILLDEPDHYIKGSERWRNMLTRYRKYHCGLVFMFHGWQQLTEVDRKLPQIIRKSAPHYVIFQTDEDNLIELQPVIEPEFKIKELAKGMPKWHAVIKLKMYNQKGEAVPAFMAKSLDIPEERFKQYDNKDLFQECAEELGRPKLEVMQELFLQSNRDYSPVDITTPVCTTGEVELDIDDDNDKDVIKNTRQEEEELEEERLEKDRHTRKLLEYKVGTYIEEQISKGEDPDEELVQHIEEIMEEG